MIYYAVAPAGYSYSGAEDAKYDTRKYNTLAAAEAALPGGAFTEPHIIEIIGDWTGVDDTPAVYFTGYTPSETNYLLVQALGEARHAGKWRSSSYRLEVSTEDACITIGHSTPHCYVDGLQLKKPTRSINGYGCILILSTSANARVSNCVVVGPSVTATDDDFGASGIMVQGDNARVWNNIVYNWLDDNPTYDSSKGIFVSSLASDARVYSCTCAKCDVGVQAQSGANPIVKNTYATVTDTVAFDAFHGTMTLTTCASSDASGSAGLQNIAADVLTFADVGDGTEDYHLVLDSPLVDAGTDTSGESAPLDFADDIDGELRAVSWSVGADQLTIIEDEEPMPFDPPTVGLQSITWMPRTAVAMSQSIFSLETQVYDWGGKQRVAEVRLAPMKREAAMQWVAFFLRCNGPANTFYFQDTNYGRFPRGAATGTPLVAAGNGALSPTLLTKGWTASTTNILRAGDWIALNDRLYQVTSDADSDGSGEASLSIWPYLPGTAPAENDVILTGADAKGVFRLQEIPAHGFDVGGVMEGITFTILEDFDAS